jgi:beta-fructofuranosidase
MITCGSIVDTISHGAVMHFESENLADWKFKGPFSIGSESNCIAWEVPNFLTFHNGRTGMLIVSPLYDNLENTDHNPRSNVIYSIAPYNGEGNFKPGEFKKLDNGNPNDFYAALSMKTPYGAWLTWGINIGGGTQGDWSTHLSIPRVLNVRSDGLLSQEPPSELQALRRGHWGACDIKLNGSYNLSPKSVTCELIVEIEPGTAKSISLELRGSEDFKTSSRICYDVAHKKLFFGEYSADFELLEGEKVLRFHAFIDRSVIETFVNKREVGTLRPNYDINYNSLRIIAEGGTAHIKTIDVWEMASIWE